MSTVTLTLVMKARMLLLVHKKEESKDMNSPSEHTATTQDAGEFLALLQEAHLPSSLLHIMSLSVDKSRRLLSATSSGQLLKYRKHAPIATPKPLAPRNVSARQKQSLQPATASAHKPRPTSSSTKDRLRKQSVAEQVPPKSKVSQTVERIFRSDRDDELAIPYAKDGDPALETPEALEKRTKLFQDDSVKEAVNQFVHVFRVEEGHVSRKEYIRVVMRILQIIYPSASESEKQAIVTRDWSVDTSRKSYEPVSPTEVSADEGVPERISIRKLRYAVFQLADVWTPSIDAAEYVAFLEGLKARIVYGSGHYDILSNLRILNPLASSAKQKHLLRSDSSVSRASSTSTTSAASASSPKRKLRRKHSKL